MLNVTLSNVEGIKTEISMPQDIEEAIRYLQELKDELEDLLPRLMPNADDGLRDRIRKGLRSLRLEKTIREQMKDVDSGTIQLGAWIGSVDLRRGVLAVLLLRWFTRKRPSVSDLDGRNFGRVLYGGFAASQGGSRLPNTRKVRKVAYRITNQDRKSVV